MSDPLVRVEAMCEPMEGYCGDYVGLVRPRPGLVLGVIADACGHGKQAAAILHGTGLEIGEERELLEESPAEAIEGAAARMYCEDGTFVTAIAFAMDLDSGEFRFAIAGHPPPVVLKAGVMVESEWTAGLPLGISARCDVVDHRLILEPGDGFALFSDGVADLVAPNGERIGFGAARSMLARALGAADPIEDLVSVLNGGDHRLELTDDTTAVFLRRMRLCGNRG